MYDKTPENFWDTGIIIIITMGKTYLSQVLRYDCKCEALADMPALMLAWIFFVSSSLSMMTYTGCKKEIQRFVVKSIVKGNTLVYSK